MERGTNEYMGIHEWLKYHYGRPEICENSECKGNGKRYEWAHKHNKPWERDRNNFLRLCSKCHAEYDIERNKKIGDSLRGVKKPPRSEDHKEKLRIAKLGTKWTNEQIEKRKKYKPSAETRKKLSEAAKKQWKNVKSR